VDEDVKRLMSQAISGILSMAALLGTDYHSDAIACKLLKNSI
jgi:hypothetical protein